MHDTAFHTQGRATQSAGLVEDGEHQEYAEGSESHVCNRRVGNELFHVLLHQGNEPDIHHRYQRQQDD